MGGRRGRRDNGLEAAEYAVAGDVDPRVGEHLLDVLAAGGIAAYLQPTADLHPITRTTIVPARPTDRLYVDREHLATARDYLAQLTGGGAESGAESKVGVPATSPPGSAPDGATTGSATTDATGPGPIDASSNSEEVEEAWARIVADLRADLDPKTSSWPDAGGTGRDGTDRGRGGRRDREDPDGGDDTGDRGTPSPRPLRRLGDDDQISLLDGLDTFGADLPDEDEGTYTPPPPPPVPRPSKIAVVAVLAILVGLALFFWPRLLPIDEDISRLAGFVACFAGATALVLRLRPGNDEDETYDPDNGAVV
jgi:hypothetical protein